MSKHRTFVPSVRDLIGMGSEIRLTFLVQPYHKKYIPYRIVSEDPLKIRWCSLGQEVYLGDEVQYVKPQVRLDQIWNKSLQDLSSGISSFCIDWYSTWISTWSLMTIEFTKRALICNRLFYIDINDSHIFLRMCWKLMINFWSWDCISHLRDCKIFIIQ